MNGAVDLHPKINLQKALEIAGQRVRNANVRWIKVYSDLPGSVQIYPRNQAKSCWSVMMSEGRGGNFQNSRLLCISQETGMITYDGSAGDEG